MKIFEMDDCGFIAIEDVISVALLRHEDGGRLSVVFKNTRSHITTYENYDDAKKSYEQLLRVMRNCTNG